MSTLSEQRITAYHQKTALGLINLIDADVPIKIKLTAVSALSRCKVQVAREKVAQFFASNPLEEDAVPPMSEIGSEIAEPLLIARLRDPFALNRDLVAERLGMFKTPTALAELKVLLGDRDRHVRWQAVNSLFAIGGKEAALAMCQYISDPDEWISMSILKLLCRLKEHESIPFLADQFNKETDLRRKAQMVNFLSMFKSVTLVNIFDEGLRSHDARLKANAIEAFSDLELPQREIAARISPYLEDPNNRIRANAILALARSEPERIRPHLVKMVESDDIQLRRSSAFILGQIAPDGNEELATRLISDASVDVRKRMVLSLRKFPIPFARTLLEKSVTDEHPWIRKHSIDLAAGYPDFPAAVVLKQLKTENAAPNLVACMDFFSKHPTDEASRLIRQRVKDKREMVVSGVIRAIGAIHGLPGLQQLAPQINYRDPKVLRSFTVTHFGLGGLEIFDSIVEKAVQVKKSQTPQNDQYLSALEGCLDLLNLGPKMPAGLKTELERPPVVQAPPPPPVAPVEPVVAPDLGQVADGVPPAPAVPAEVPMVAAAAEGAADEGEEREKSPKKSSKPKLPAAFSAGLKHYNLGKYAKARKCFQEALADHPDLVKGHFYLGMIAFEEKEYDQARESLAIFLEQEPDNVKALTTLGRVYKSGRDWPGVARVYNHLLGLGEELPKKTSFRVQRDLGMAHIFMRDYEQAKNVLEGVFKLDPTDPDTNFHLAMAYFHLQNYLRAETLLMDLVRELPEGEKQRSMAESLLEKLRANLTSQREEGGSAPVAPPAPPASLAEVPGEGEAAGDTPPAEEEFDPDPQPKGDTVHPALAGFEFELPPAPPPVPPEPDPHEVGSGRLQPGMAAPNGSLEHCKRPPVAPVSVEASPLPVLDLSDGSGPSGGGGAGGGFLDLSEMSLEPLEKPAQPAGEEIPGFDLSGFDPQATGTGQPASPVTPARPLPPRPPVAPVAEIPSLDLPDLAEALKGVDLDQPAPPAPPAPPAAPVMPATPPASPQPPRAPMARPPVPGAAPGAGIPGAPRPPVPTAPGMRPPIPTAPVRPAGPLPKPTAPRPPGAPGLPGQSGHPPLPGVPTTPGAAPRPGVPRSPIPGAPARPGAPAPTAPGVPPAPGGGPKKPSDGEGSGGGNDGFNLPPV